MLKDGYCRTDYPDCQIYHREDVMWGIWPDHETGDPGWLVPKPNAIPVSEDEGMEP